MGGGLLGGMLDMGSDMAEIASLGVLRDIKSELAALNSYVRDPVDDPEAERQVIIEMDGKKVADTVMKRINRNSTLTITKTV